MRTVTQAVGRKQRAVHVHEHVNDHVQVHNYESIIAREPSTGCLRRTADNKPIRNVDVTVDVDVLVVVDVDGSGKLSEFFQTS